MCRALRILCAASEPDELTNLRKAAVSAQWEVVGGAASVDDLMKQIDEWNPDVVIIDAAMGPEAVRAVRKARPAIRIVTLGAASAGEDMAAHSLPDVRRAMLALPRTGGPVRS